MKVDNYQILEQIGVTDCCALYLARHIHTGTTTLLKLPASGSAADALRQEYALLQSLDVPEILKPLALLEDGPHVAMVLEPFIAESLDATLARQPNFSLMEALNIALQAVRALAALHAAGIVHRDIRPANFLLAHDHDNVQMKLADLSHATARDGAASARTAAGSDWAYISPEQTGRMNCQPDHRSDFYSLGIMLYRLLSGQLPFQADDPLEWVHCHLARMPVPPHELDPALPPAVSDLVLKLLAKVPDDRYQSANGLMADLEHCLARWQATGEIAPFALGQRDVADRFRIPLKLYGRERERAALLDALETVATTGATTLLTVAGYSGIGKSALIHALQQPVVDKCGYFLAGKFDQYQRDIPYATLAQAFDGLVRQLAGESDTGIMRWRETLHEALEPNAQLMVSLIPRLELVIGPQPPVSELPPQQAQGRFQFVFRRFLGVLATQESPLVLFLDDLQWVDAGTLALLADLATHPDVRYLLLVGAYRDNEVDSNHPLMKGLAAIRQEGGATQSIVLASLSLDDVAQLAAESMHCQLAEARPLAELVWDKTGGNPFFTRQFLAALAEEKLVQFDAGQGGWRWDLSRIHAKGFTDNVVELMVSKLVRLPQETQEALARFACLGNAADAATLGIVLERSVEAVHTLLRDAERVGLVCGQEDSYRFLHDRVQEASYSLIPATARAAMHLRIGRLLASSLRPEAVADRIFEVVGQLNRGSELVESQEERDRIAELNLMAGRRAKAAIAFASALSYFTTGVRLLADDGWDRRYDLAFWLAFHQAECEFLTEATKDAESHLAALSARAASVTDKASVVRLRMDIYMAQGQPAGAIGLGLEHLRRLGIEWSLHPTEAEVLHECERIRSNLGKREIEDLADLPLATDPTALATLDVLIGLVPPSGYTDANLKALLICRGVNLSLEHGNSDASCYAYAHLATVLAHYLGDYRNGARFGRLGYELVERKGLRRFGGATSFVYGRMVLAWTSPLRISSDFLQRATDGALRSGDFNSAAWCYSGLSVILLARGVALPELQGHLERPTAFGKRYRDTVLLTITQIGFIRMLRGLMPTFGTLFDQEDDEARMEEQLAGNPALVFAAFAYWIVKLQARYLAGDVASALQASSNAERTLWTSREFFETADHHFYSALARAADCDCASADQRARHLEAILVHQRQLGVWAESCPETFENRLALVAAELARLEDRDMDAQRLYERAIRSARDNGFVNNEALANELAARFCLDRGLETPGLAYLRNARACYARWGADGKVRQLEERYPHLRTRGKGAAAGSLEGEVRLDLLSVAKASQAISSQIVLDDLIDTLMRLVLESAGAQTGCLLLMRDDELGLAAEATVEQQTVKVRRHAGIALSEDRLPLTLLQYVRRSREPVLLTEASAQHPFATDPYFAHQPPQSALCLPVLRQATLVGILYLENRLATQTFSPERVQVLELLASQAAISLDNARLYADVRDSHARIRRLVESNIIGIGFWDVNGRISDANDAFLEIVGYSRQDFLSGALNWERMTPPEYRELDARNVAQLRATGACLPFEKEFFRKDGSRIPVLIGATLFDDSRDQGVAFVLDLSERKRAETERQARQAAEAANRAKSIFLANMSHELRTPLNSILGYAQILECDPALDASHVAKAKVICKSGEHLLTLINDILDLAKIEAGKMEIYPDVLPFQSIIQDIIEIAGVKAAQKGLALVCDLGQDVPQWIRADGKRLRQVLLNLLSNAVKFTDRGQVALRVRFAPPDRWRFEVADTGVGIAADQLETIFEPFEQAGDRQYRAAGTGLGLAISRQYARLMGGDIRVESQPGQGSTFHVEIQAQTMDSPTEAPKLAASVKNLTGYAGSRKKVLVVDDIAENRALMTDLLTPLGFEVMEAVNGREGLEAAQRLRPDLILMDIAMPQLDGMAATRLLRQSNICREVPVIAVSASVSASDSEQCLAAGMNAFLPKPVDADKLLEHMARLLQLEWTYRTAQAPSEAGVMAAPPAEEMEVLYRLARLGNMQEILAQADRLARLDERYRPFADRLISLAQDYQSKAVLQLVEAHLQGSLVAHR